MSDFQKSFSESTSSIKFDEKYIDTSVQPNDIGVAEQWAVKTVADPCVGNLATPVNSCLLYTSPSPRDPNRSRMPSSA